MKQNGAKARKILLLVTIESCSFLIYQLTFCVQNSCISNSPHKMSACSGTVSRVAPTSSACTMAQCHPIAESLPLGDVAGSFSEWICADELQMPSTILLSTFLHNELESLCFSFSKVLCQKEQSEKKVIFCIILFELKETFKITIE
jgi:hypothetical protein